LGGKSSLSDEFLVHDRAREQEAMEEEKAATAGD